MFVQMVVYILSLDEIEAVTPLISCHRQGHGSFEVTYSGVNKRFLYNLYHKLFTFQYIKKVALIIRNIFSLTFKCHCLKCLIQP
jgi:hypothetical protein